MPPLNIRRGLFRLWIVLYALFVTAVTSFSAESIMREFRLRDVVQHRATVLLPVTCSIARGTVERDYRTLPGLWDKYRAAPAPDLCWYDAPDFRRLFPEHGDVSDDELSSRLYSAAGIALTPRRPWGMVPDTAVLALSVPSAVLVIGWAFFWAFSGFGGRRTP